MYEGGLRYLEVRTGILMLFMDTCCLKRVVWVTHGLNVWSQYDVGAAGNVRATEMCCGSTKAPQRGAF